jgi:hypothetical protein
LTEDFERRYPIKRTRYTQSVGKLLPHRISQIFQELGFKTWINSGQGNDIDIKVFIGDKLIIVAEILNWSVGSMLSEKRKNSIIDNLSKYDCIKLLIYTVLDDNSLKDFRRNGISLIEIGYQLLPKKFFDFFSMTIRIKSRRVDSKETKGDMESKIEDFLSSSEIIDNDNLVICSLFQNKMLFLFLPFKKEIIMRKAQKRFEYLLDILFISQGSKKLEIKTMCGKMNINRYLRKIVKNIFDCLITNRETYLGNFIPPDRLYHGTTSKFLCKIVREGLIPSSPGQYWDEDKHKWVKRVDLTDNIYAAEYFAIIAANRFGGNPIIIEVDVNGLKDKLKVRSWYLPTRCVIDFFKEIYFTRVIPSKRIKNWYFIPSPSAYELVNLIINYSRFSS